MEIGKANPPIDPYRRPGHKLLDVRGIVMHWVANPGITPWGVQKFWIERGNFYGSAHYIIGNDGEIIEFVPPDEVAYHCGSQTYTELAEYIFGEEATRRRSPNWYSIGIELCHIDWEGTFTPECLSSATRLCHNLCMEHGLNPLWIVTHNMVVGWKDCPKKWVQNPHLFEQFRHDVIDYMAGTTTAKGSLPL